MAGIHIPEYPELAVAYNSIYEFFDYWGFPESRRLLNKMLRAAYSNKKDKMNYRVSTVLYLTETLEKLITAALQIHKSRHRDKTAIIEGNMGRPDILDFQNYCGMQPRYSPWDYFPRSLSRKEFLNPNLVFKKVAALGDEEEWKKILKELQYYTYEPFSFSENGDLFDFFRVNQLLNKTLEASFLIHTRSIVEVEGRIIRKWKDKQQNKPEVQNQTPGEETHTDAASSEEADQ